MAQKNKRRNQSPMLFEAVNYTWLIVGLVLVTGGFTAMYLENKVSGFISLYISPIVIIAGYITVIFSIMIKTAGDRASHDPNVN